MRDASKRAFLEQLVGLHGTEVGRQLLGCLAAHSGSSYSYTLSNLRRDLYYLENIMQAVWLLLLPGVGPALAV